MVTHKFSATQLGHGRAGQAKPPRRRMIMSIQTYDSALDFVPVAKRKPNSSAWGAIVLSFDAIREGITLAGEYKELTNRGMASDAAARKVFEKIK
jgi:hypothetical protein